MTALLPFKAPALDWRDETRSRLSRVRSELLEQAEPPARPWAEEHLELGSGDLMRFWRPTVARLEAGTVRVEVHGRPRLLMAPASLPVVPGLVVEALGPASLRLVPRR